MNKAIHSRFYKAILLSVLTLSFGLGGFLFLFDYSFVDALYMTIITMTTVGFGEVHPFGNGEKIFSVFLILTSIFTFGYVISSISEYLLSANFLKRLRQKRITKQIEQMKNHTIVCGYGGNGQEIVETLISYGREIVVIDEDEKKLQTLENKEIVTIKGDATLDEILIKAGVKNASSLITSLSSDADNLFVVLTTKQLNKNCKIVSKASNDSACKKMKFAGADNVIMPNKIGGGHMASLVVTPDLIEFVDNLKLHGDTNANLREIAINDIPKQFIGKTILDLDLRRKTGCNVIGFKNKARQYVINPEVTTRLEPGTFLIVLGRPKQIDLLKELI